MLYSFPHKSTYNNLVQIVSVFTKIVIYQFVICMHCSVKIVKKLAGKASFIAAWATNVGTEFGQVLLSVLTAAEGNWEIWKSQERHIECIQDPAVYTNRDCGERLFTNKYPR